MARAIRNLSPAEQSFAEDQAKAAATRLGYKVAGVVCNAVDTDADRYTSCMIRIEGQTPPLNWECGYGGEYGATGCKEKMKIQVQQQ